jgi:CxxC motif-containing protein
MKQIVCIVCPNSCHLQIDEKTFQVTGQLCSRGAAYAKQELLDPKRTLTSSVKTIYKAHPVVSVRTTGEISKTIIPEVLAALRQIVIDKPLPRGSVIIDNVADSGIDIITTSTLDGE